MSELQSFTEFLSTTTTEIPVIYFVLNLIITALLGLILGKVYSLYGDSLSNRNLFGRNLLIISLTTMLIITIVKSSLALSLGLVGALSIVRFRAAIKEPEELSYLFLSIAIGLGFGADQGIITTVAFFLILAMIVGRKMILKKEEYAKHFHMVITSTNVNKVNIDDIVESLKKHSSIVNLRRFDDSKEIFEASFTLHLNNYNDLSTLRDSLKKLDSTMNIKFLDNTREY